MKKLKGIILIAVIALVVGVSFLFTENYSNGERIGTVTQFSKTGRWDIFKSYEGHLNVTQTGMNSSTGFDFSVDNDKEPAGIVAKLDSAANLGWKVKITYHQVYGWNWFHNRGNTNYFVTDVTILDKNFDNPFGNKKSTNDAMSNGNPVSNGSGGRTDTIYVVVMPGNPDYSKFLSNKKDSIR